MNSASIGLAAFAGASLAVMTTAALLWGDAPTASTPAPAPGSLPTQPHVSPLVPSAAGSGATPERRPTSGAEAEHLLQRLIERLAHVPGLEDDERAGLERELLSLGEAAAPPLVARLKSEPSGERQRSLLDLLRKLPGDAAEDYFVEQARQAPERSIRALSMDALADRRSDRALDALDRIATTDPELPKKPFLAGPRRPADDSTELPDEVTFTPRMKAMSALASTGDARATATLAGILRSESEESLRMEAARDLAQLRGDPAAFDALVDALADRSAYVRLAALHSLDGLDDPRLAPRLAQLEHTDTDLGVRALARRLQERLASAP